MQTQLFERLLALEISIVKAVRAANSPATINLSDLIDENDSEEVKEMLIRMPFVKLRDGKITVD